MFINVNIIISAVITVKIVHHVNIDVSIGHVEHRVIGIYTAAEVVSLLQPVPRG